MIPISAHLHRKLMLFLSVAIALAVGFSSFGTGASLKLPNQPGDNLTKTISLSAEPTRFLPGDWDGRSVRKAAVIQRLAAFEMWYDGADYWNNNRIGLATSVDGIDWTKYSDNPVLIGDEGAWDAEGEHAPFVMYQAGQYKMWYEGGNGTLRQLGYATSPDGINWTKHADNPVLEAGPELYDQDVAGHGTIIYEAPTYKLWYHAIGNEGIGIAYATSTDGVSWNKVDAVMMPVMGEWDEYGLWGPSVLKEGDTYWMWYSGSGPSYLPAVGAATSTDGINWHKVGDTPLITLGSDAIGDPSVLLDGETFKMWFNNFTDGKIYTTESADGEVWDTPVEALAPGLLHPLDGFHDGTDGVVRSTGCSAFGWVVDPDDPSRDVTVQVLVDGILLEELVANQDREDVDPLICPGGTCGYAVNLWGEVSAGEVHSITVQAYDVESDDWWGLEGTPKSLTCWGYPEGPHDGDDGVVSYPACTAFGWVVDPDEPERDVQVRLLADDVQIATANAVLLREDLGEVCPGGTCSYSIPLWDKIPFNQPLELTVQAYDVESEAWWDLGATPKTLTCQGGKLYLPALTRIE